MPESEDYVELSAPEHHVDKDSLHPGRMRRFVTHLSAAAREAEERSAKKQEIKDKIERVKAVSLNKRSTKQQIEHELGSFESTVKEIIHDEEKILSEQRKETRQIIELKAMVENLSGKLIEIGREYARELEEKDEKIMELREALAAANIKMSESGEERQRKIADIERKLKQRPASPPPKSKDDHIADMEAHLKSLEERHRELKRSGQHSSEDLDRVQSVIDRHKRSLAQARGEKVELETPKKLKTATLKPGSKPWQNIEPKPKKRPAKKKAKAKKKKAKKK